MLKPQTTQKHYQNQNIKIAIPIAIFGRYNFLSVHSFSIVSIYLKLLNPWFPHSFILTIILSHNFKPAAAPPGLVAVLYSPDTNTAIKPGPAGTIPLYMPHSCLKSPCRGFPIVVCEADLYIL